MDTNFLLFLATSVLDSALRPHVEQLTTFVYVILVRRKEGIHELQSLWSS